MATIHLHPTLAADHKAAQALADSHGLQVMIHGASATLEPITCPARIPAPSSWSARRASRPFNGGDAA